MITLLSGEVTPEPMPPGLDEDFDADGARLGCIGIPKVMLTSIFCP